jgi:hypothetical protein
MGEENETEDREIVPVNGEIEEKDEWIFPAPKTNTEKFFARIAVIWQNKAEKEKEERKKEYARAERFKVKFEQERTQRELEHQEFVSTRGEADDLGIEVDGLIRRDANVKKRVTAELLMEKAAHKDLDDALGNRQPKTWLRFTWEVVALAAIILTVIMIAYNAPFRLWIGQNIIAILIGLGIFGFIVYSVYNNKKGK